MSTRYFDLNKSLRKALNAVTVTANSVTLPKYYQGQTAAAAGPYLYAWLLTNEPDGAEIGNALTERVTGIYQIDIYTPAAPEWASQDLIIADQLSTAFYRGRSIDDCIRIERVTKGRTVTDGGYWKTTIDVTFYTYSPAG